MTEREKLIELVHNARMNALWHNAQKPSEYITDMLISDGVTVRERGRWDDGVCTACDFDIRDMIDGDSDFRNWVWDGIPFCPNCGADMRQEEKDGN